MGSRVLGSVSVVLLLSSVTPAHRIFHSLRWLGVPRGWVEIATLMYRYIFTLLDQTADVLAAQRVRLGYSGLKRSLVSLGVLTGAVIVQSLEQATRTYEAMSLRGYQGQICRLDRFRHCPGRMWTIGTDRRGCGWHPSCSGMGSSVMANPLAIEARQVCFTYQEGTRALTDVDFHVEPGEFVAMLASNGSGKTALIKVLVGLLKPQRRGSLHCRPGYPQSASH